MPTTHPLPGALREFARLAAQLLGGDVAWPIRVTLKDRCGTAHRLYLEAPAGGADTAPDTARPLTPMMADALEAAGATPRSSVELAGLAGWDYAGRWRGTVAKLVRGGYLERDQRTRKLTRTDSGAERLRAHRGSEDAEE